jgi:hypothetical protein
MNKDDAAQPEDGDAHRKAEAWNNALLAHETEDLKTEDKRLESAISSLMSGVWKRSDLMSSYYFAP